MIGLEISHLSLGIWVVPVDAEYYVSFRMRRLFLI